MCLSVVNWFIGGRFTAENDAVQGITKLQLVESFCDHYANHVATIPYPFNNQVQEVQVKDVTFTTAVLLVEFGLNFVEVAVKMLYVCLCCVWQCRYNECSSKTCYCNLSTSSFCRASPTVIFVVTGVFDSVACFYC